MAANRRLSSLFRPKYQAKSRVRTPIHIAMETACEMLESSGQSPAAELGYVPGIGGQSRIQALVALMDFGHDLLPDCLGRI